MNFPDNFFQDEYRCDFLVPELMKRAWAAEIEILEVIANICKKYNYSILQTVARCWALFVIKVLCRGTMTLISP